MLQCRQFYPGLRRHAGERWVWQSIGGLEHSRRIGAPALERIFGTSLFDYYAAGPDAARVGVEGLTSGGCGQDAR